MRIATLLALICTVACRPEGRMIAEAFDTQGHRGARGNRPENTLEAFRFAVEHGMRTLELDLAVSSDGVLVVSHEPWFSDAICAGAPAEDVSLHQMTVEEIQSYDCGSLRNPDYPYQQNAPAVKPTLAEVVDASDAYAVALDRPLPRYNIEIKWEPEYVPKYAPTAEAFAKTVIAFLRGRGLVYRVTVQSFATEVLEQMRRQAPEVELAFLDAGASLIAGGQETEFSSLTFRPAIYSPYHLTLRPGRIDALHELGVRVVPWTVNDTSRMRTLLRWGVDGIISDYPERLRSVVEDVRPAS